MYGRLSAEQAQHLAHRHNRATEFTSKMNTQDKVYWQSTLNRSMHARSKLMIVVEES